MADAKTDTKAETKKGATALAVSPKRKTELEKLTVRKLEIGVSKEEQAKALEENYDPNTEAPGLSRIKFPSGGSKQFLLASGEARDSLVGVVVFHHTSRGYWPSRDTTGTPPTCSSLNGVTGTLQRNGAGEFGDCASCKWNQFGSDKGGGRGKACKETRRMYLLMDGEDMPRLLSLPPGSLKSWKTFRDERLTPSWIGLREIVVEIGADLTKNPAGQTYAVASFKIAGRLSESDHARTEAMHSVVSVAAQKVAVDEGDYDTSGSAGESQQSSGSPPVRDEDDNRPNSEKARAPARQVPQSSTVVIPSWVNVNASAPTARRKVTVLEPLEPKYEGYDGMPNDRVPPMVTPIRFQTPKGTFTAIVVGEDKLADQAGKGSELDLEGYMDDFKGQKVFRVKAVHGHVPPKSDDDIPF